MRRGVEHREVEDDEVEAVARQHEQSRAAGWISESSSEDSEDFVRRVSYSLDLAAGPPVGPPDSAEEIRRYIMVAGWASLRGAEDHEDPAWRRLQQFLRV